MAFGKDDIFRQLLEQICTTKNSQELKLLDLIDDCLLPSHFCLTKQNRFLTQNKFERIQQIRRDFWDLMWFEKKRICDQKYSARLILVQVAGIGNVAIFSRAFQE